MTKRRLRSVVAVAAVAVLFLMGLFVASTVNAEAADDKCGVLLAFDERFADANEVAFDNELFPQRVTCRFDNGKTLSYRWWPTARP